MSKPPHTYIIAEAGVNHNGSLDLAKQLIDVAEEAGADAVKFQTFKTEQLLCPNAPKADYQQKNTGATETQRDMIKRLELDEPAHEVLIRHCQQRNIQFLSTPFDLESVDLLAKRFDLPYIKVSSGEITNGPLLLKIAQTKKPVILSTGMSTLGEIETALGVLAFGYLAWAKKPSATAFQEAFASPEGQQRLQHNVTLLQCTTEYPAPFNEVNLRNMRTLQAAFHLPVGLSDHTEGVAIPIAAVAQGAVMVEKHFTLDRRLPGPDHKASLEPYELEQMIKCIRQVEQALGSPLKMPSWSEAKNRPIARKSIVAAGRINKGEIFTAANIAIKRPGTGMSPMRYWDLLGKAANRDYLPNEQVEL